MRKAGHIISEVEKFIGARRPRVAVYLLGLSRVINPVRKQEVKDVHDLIVTFKFSFEWKNDGSVSEGDQNSFKRRLWQCDDHDFAPFELRDISWRPRPLGQTWKSVSSEIILIIDFARTC